MCRTHHHGFAIFFTQEEQLQQPWIGRLGARIHLYLDQRAHPHAAGNVDPAAFDLHPDQTPAEDHPLPLASRDRLGSVRPRPPSASVRGCPFIDVWRLVWRVSRAVFP